MAEPSWSQRLAVYWAISWPASIISSIIGFLFVSRFSGPYYGLSVELFFYSLQLLLTVRVVSRTYKGFRLHVAREAGVIDHKLSIGERSRVWLWIAGPQAALYFSAMALASFAPADALRGLVLPMAAAKYLWAGPYGVGLAIKANYGRFRIQ